MENSEWNTIALLVDAKRSLAEAWGVLDGTDGAAPGSEHALGAALAAIDALYAIESSHDANADVSAPDEIAAFWDAHGALPGFAAGT